MLKATQNLGWPEKLGPRNITFDQENAVCDSATYLDRNAGYQ